MNTFISAFAQDTRHRARHLEKEAAVNKLVQKFVATQVPLVNWKLVYPFVSDDLDVIEFRAPAVLESYINGKEIPLAVCQEIYSQLNDKVDEFPLLAEYAEATGIPPEKSGLYFFLQDKFTPAQLLELGDFADQFAAQEYYERATNYKTEVPQLQVIHQLADMINSMQFPSLYIYYVMKDNPDEEEEDEEEEEETEPQEVQIEIAEPKELNFDEQENPILKEYRRRQQVGALFPTHKLATQILCTHAAQDTSRIADLIAPLLGKRQYAQTLDPPRYQETPQEVFDVVHTLPKERIATILQDPQMRAFIRQDGRNYKKTGHQLVEDIVRFYASAPNNDELSKRQKNFLQEYPHLSTRIIKQFI